MSSCNINTLSSDGIIDMICEEAGLKKKFFVCVRKLKKKKKNTKETLQDQKTFVHLQAGGFSKEQKN